MIVRIMSKVSLVSQVIKHRIAHADDLLDGIPSERRFAIELGVSRTTIRAAIENMLKSGILAREPNGRLRVGHSAREQSQRTLGLVVPNGGASEINLWRDGIMMALDGQPMTLRTVTYAHLADASIADALASFDGVFFVPQTRDIPQWLLAQLQNSSKRVVVLDQDASADGLPSVVIFPPESSRSLLDHLVELGHRRIDCIITQEDPDPSRGRAGYWQRYLAEKNLSGHLHALMIGNPLQAGYQLIKDALANGDALGTAFYCTSVWPAIGAMRALSEAGLEIGRDVSVCAVNDENLGRYLLKSLTALESPPRASCLRHPIDWMLGEEKEWTGPLLICPEEVPLFKGESSGPAPKE